MEVYGKAFDRPPAEHVTFTYRPQVDIVGPGDGKVRDQLRALLTQALPDVLERLLPVPVLFDMFHVLPLTMRNREEDVLTASRGWMTLLQPITVPQV